MKLFSEPEPNSRTPLCHMFCVSKKQGTGLVKKKKKIVEKEKKKKKKSCEKNEKELKNK